VAIIEDILRSIDSDAPVRDLRVCVRTTAVWSRRLGLAYTFPRIHLQRGSKAKGPRLRDSSARKLAELALSDDLLHASVGVAAINSLLDPDRLPRSDGNAHDLILERGDGQDVTVVGHFPFVEWLRDRVRNLWVLELDPREGDLPARAAKEVIPKSAVVAITSTALINHTIEPLLELARDSFTIVLGPSTPLSPVLFDHGVDAVCGSIVVDPEEALLDASEGASFRRMRGLRAINALRASAGPGGQR